MKLKKSSEQSRERRKKRSANPTIVIVCEGKDTEVKYFENFNSRYTRVDVKMPDKNSVGKNKGKKTDCESLIKKAIEYKQNKYDIKEEDGDRVWCIFDVDINHNNNNAIQSKIDEISTAQTLAQKSKIKLGISNPCFELWYLLHFKYTTSYLKDYSSVKDILEKETPFKNYTKNKDVYDLLKDKIPNAIQNGIKLQKYHEKDGKILSTVELTKQNIKDIVQSNPYTNIMDLVQYIENLNHRK